ncbi:diguanylate cyclase domain-containing protein [Streptomyces aidingensis]|uniref:diguanylate cyclase domain-containing protein n=1 Tax=Streptomyces aidingensis TaxID=910347 RepID=UPI001FE512B3|nr:diguanylate cyclase [Streptomyces aidingensis]
MCAGYATGAAFGWGSTRLALIMGDFGLSAAALVACGSCLSYAWMRAGRFRPAWTLFGLSSLMLGLGNGVWGWYEVVLARPVPRTSAADLCFLLFAPLAIVGLLMLAKRPVSRAGWICLVLDAWLIGGSLLILSWSLALAHTAQVQGETVFRAALSLAYPLLDIALVSMVLVLHFRRTTVHRCAINTAIGSLALTVLCDALFISPLMQEQYASGQLLDAGWFTGSLLLAAAPWLADDARVCGSAAAAAADGAPAGEHAGPGPEPDRAADRIPAHSAVQGPGPVHAPPGAPPGGARPLIGSLTALTPYLAAAVCTLSILLSTVNGGAPDRVVLFSACALVLALLARQGIMLLDNIALTRELARAESHFRSMVQGSSDVIMIAAPDGVLRYVSPAAAGVLGQEAETLYGRRLTSLIHPEDTGPVTHELRRFLSVPAAQEPATRVECRVRHGAGHWLNVESTVNRHQGGLIFNSRDVTERVRLQEQLQHSASHDPLTDLPNRALFTERVRQAISGRRSGDTPAAAVFYIDLDGFKAVNDTVGHQAGDELLVQAARRLRESVRAGDTTARLGGDEFAALLTGEPGEDQETAGSGAAGGGAVARSREQRVLEIAERVRGALSRPYRLAQTEVRVAASIGVAFAEPGITPVVLLRNADLAMYRAKQNGKARVELYTATPPVDGPRPAAGLVAPPARPLPAAPGRAAAPQPPAGAVPRAAAARAAVGPVPGGTAGEAAGSTGNGHREGFPARTSAPAPHSAVAAGSGDPVPAGPVPGERGRASGGRAGEAAGSTGNGHREGFPAPVAPGQRPAGVPAGPATGGRDAAPVRLPVPGEPAGPAADDPLDGAVPGSPVRAYSGGFRLLHRPVAALADGRIVALAAVAVWSGGRPQPAAELSHWLLEEAVAAAGRRAGAGAPPGSGHPVRVPLTASRLADRAFAPGAVQGLLDRHAVPPSALTLLLREGEACLRNPDLLGRLAALRALGIAVCLDGYGCTGPSPAVLHRLPLTAVRLGRELVGGLPENAALRTLTAGLLRLADGEGLRTCAEGVDLPEQAAELHALGCAEGQGRVFGEPQEEAELRHTLTRGRVRPNSETSVRLA